MFVHYVLLVMYTGFYC